MLANKKDNIAFTAHLFINGLPVVLNQQRLKQRLRETRLTRRQQLDYEVALADSSEASLITVADREDYKPALLKFTPKGDSYTISLVQRGAYDGAHLSFERGSHNLRVGQSERSELFSIIKAGGLAGYSDFASGPAYIELKSEANEKLIYRSTEAKINLFMNVDPNSTGHVAYNNKPAVFVMKIIEKLTVAA